MNSAWCEVAASLTEPSVSKSIFTSATETENSENSARQELATNQADHLAGSTRKADIRQGADSTQVLRDASHIWQSHVLSPFCDIGLEYGAAFLLVATFIAETIIMQHLFQTRLPKCADNG